VFGIRRSADTRAALRFFSERRIKTHLVDLNERAASLGELRRFAQKFGVPALIDRNSKRFAELGLASARLSDERWLETLSLEPLLLRVPLVLVVHPSVPAKNLQELVAYIKAHHISFVPTIANGESGYYYVEHPEFLNMGPKLDGFYARGRTRLTDPA